jgi:hypothetical protein
VSAPSLVASPSCDEAGLLDGSSIARARSLGRRPATGEACRQAMRLLVPQAEASSIDQR